MPAGSEVLGTSSQRAVVVGNVIESVGEGIDCMAQGAVIRTNKIRDIFDWGVKFVHGAKNGLVEDNDIGAAGTGSIVVSGTSEPSYGDTTGQLIRNNRITQVGGLNAFCGSAIPAPYRIYATCPTTPTAAEFNVIPNGGVGDPMNTSNVGGDPDDALTGDFNGDGSTDIFFYWRNACTNRFYYGAAGGTFANVDDPILASDIGNSPQTVITLDANQDGRDDLLFWWPANELRQLYLGRGNRTFLRE